MSNKKDKNDEVTSISSIEEYIQELNKKSSDLEKNYIFRGQRNIEWKIVSSYYRRLNLGKEKNKIIPTKSQFIQYHQELLKEAKDYQYHKDYKGQILNDIQLLAELQHYQAATGLIDFSSDALISLWFACEDFSEEKEGSILKKDGCVFILHIGSVDFKPLSIEDNQEEIKAILDKLDNNKFYYLKPKFKSNTRIFAQKGVFIFGSENLESVITPVKKICIKADKKREIREYLSLHFAVNEKTLFQDIYGFATVNSYDRPISSEKTPEEIFKKGLHYFQEEQYLKAIESWEGYIKTNPKDDNALFLIGNVYFKLEEYEKAVEFYKESIQVNFQAMNAFFNMGLAYTELEQYEKAINTYKKTIEIDPEYESLAYIYLIELFLVTNKPFEQNLVTEFQKRFATDEEAMIQFDMLKILKDSLSFTQEDLGKKLKFFKNQYSSNIGLDSWSWQPIEKWAEKLNNYNVKKAVDFFKRRKQKIDEFM